MSSQGIVALSYPWVWVGTLVAAIFGVQCIRYARAGRFDETFLLTFGIFITWLSDSTVLRTWYTIWRNYHNQSPELAAWMLTHWTIPVATLGVIIGGLIHIRTATRDRMGVWGWCLAAGIGAGLYAIAIGNV